MSMKKSASIRILAALFVGLTVLFGVVPFAGCYGVHAEVLRAQSADVTKPEGDKPSEPICTGSPCIAKAAIVGSIRPPLDRAIADFMMRAQEAHADAVMLIINSPGGEVGTSKHIFEILRASKVPTFCYVPKLAASGAFWILQGCTERVASPEALLMIHAPYATASEGMKLDIATLHQIASELEAEANIMAAQMAPRMKLTPAEMKERMLKGDWFMAGEAAIGNHAIDKLVDGSKTYLDEVTARFQRSAKK